MDIAVLPNPVLSNQSANRSPIVQIAAPAIGPECPQSRTIVPAMETAAKHQNRVTELSSVEQPNRKCLRVMLARVSIVSKSGS
jgi:hypothetical protein